MFTKSAFSLTLFISCMNGMGSGFRPGEVDSSSLMYKCEETRYPKDAARCFAYFCQDIKGSFIAAISNELVKEKYPNFEGNALGLVAKKFSMIDEYGLLIAFNQDVEAFRSFLNLAYDVAMKKKKNFQGDIHTYADYFQNVMPYKGENKVLYQAFFKKLAIQYFITEYGLSQNFVGLDWCTCAKMPLWARLNSITYIYLLLLRRRENTFDEKFKYISFGSGGLLHDYLTCFAIQSAGYEDITLHGIDIVYENDKYKEILSNMLRYYFINLYSHQKNVGIKFELYGNAEKFEVHGNVDMIITTDTSDLISASIEKGTHFRVAIKDERLNEFWLDCSYKKYALGRVEQWTSFSGVPISDKMNLLRERLVQSFIRINMGSWPVDHAKYANAAKEIFNEWRIQAPEYFVEEAECKEKTKRYFKILVEKFANNDPVENPSGKTLILTTQNCLTKLYLKKS